MKTIRVYVFARFLTMFGGHIAVAIPLKMPLFPAQALPHPKFCFSLCWPWQEEQDGQTTLLGSTLYEYSESAPPVRAADARPGLMQSWS